MSYISAKSPYMTNCLYRIELLLKLLSNSFISCHKHQTETLNTHQLITKVLITELNKYLHKCAKYFTSIAVLHC